MKRKAVESHADMGVAFDGDGDRVGFDDGIYAAARMIGILSRSSLMLSETVRRLPSYVSTPEERIQCSDERKFKIVEKVKQQLQLEGHKTIDIDGVRIELEDAWGLIRALNTEPAIALRFEGKTLSSVEKCRRYSEESTRQGIEERLGEI